MWSKEWPTQPDLYWMYSKTYLFFVRVWLGNSNELLYDCEGHFIYKNLFKDEVLWKSIDLPKLPEE